MGCSVAGLGDMWCGVDCNGSIEQIYFVPMHSEYEEIRDDDVEVGS